MAQQKIKAEQCNVYGSATDELLALTGTTLDLGVNSLTTTSSITANSVDVGIGSFAGSTMTLTGNITSTGILPPSNNFGNIGASGFAWNNGRFTNLTIDANLNIGGNLDMQDNDMIRMGTDDDFEIYTDGANAYIDLNTALGNMFVRDNATTRFTFNKSTGDFTATGNVTAYSDERVKTNINTIEGAIDKVKQIDGVTYQRTDIEDSRMLAGVLAQQVEKVLPEVVYTSEETGMKSVAYGNIVGLLIEAIKEQQKEIEELKARTGMK